MSDIAPKSLDILVQTEEPDSTETICGSLRRSSNSLNKRKSSLHLDDDQLEYTVIDKASAPDAALLPQAQAPQGWANDEGRLSRRDNWLPAILYALFAALRDSFLGRR